MLRAMAASIEACGTCSTPSEARARVTLWPAMKEVIVYSSDLPPPTRNTRASTKRR